MKKVALIFISSIFLHYCDAQIAANTLMAGGGLGFQFSTDRENHVSNSTFTFAPVFGGFVAKNLVIGVQPYVQYAGSSGGYDYTDSTTIPVSKIHVDITQHKLSLGIGPYIRYYVRIGPKVYFFVHGSPSIMSQWTQLYSDPNQPKQKEVTASWVLGPGLSVMLSKMVAIEVSLYYNGTYHKTALLTNGNLLSETQGYVDNGMVFNVGFQLYFERTKKK